jgi:hypothetical protein
MAADEYDRKLEHGKFFALSVRGGENCKNQQGHYKNFFHGDFHDFLIFR